MANSTKAFGLSPIVSGGAAIGQNHYFINSSYGTPLFIGDPVVITGTANTNNILANGRKYKAGSLPEIQKATAGAGNPISGVIVGFVPLSSSSLSTYNPASTERVAIVCDDPYQLFLIKAETAGTALAATSIGLNANLVYADSGDTLSGFSGAELDTSTPATTQNFQLKIRRILDVEENDLGVNVNAVVQINQHTFGLNTAGV